MPHEQLNLSSSKPVLSWANHQLDRRESEMASNVAALPFVFKHVALMPDVHLGKGALVGSVIATKDAVIPAAVGVDIGCFTGDTEIPVVNGKKYSIAELANQKDSFYVYACTNSGKIVCAEAIARKTRTNAALVKVVLDNQCEIRCTPDHKFMLRDGSYRQASDLQENDSLMPFYSKQDRDGYTLIQQNYSGRWQKAHWVIARSGILGKVPKFEDQKTVIHHKNFNKADNRPENLEFMGNCEHSAVKSPIGLHNHRKYQHGYNHKVTAVIPSAEQEDVYCLSVPEYNNFALSAGVFVHNCGMAAIKLPFTGDRLEGKLKK
ncbi:MAG: RtcB family protein, partial [Cyanobacteria bacterium P01_A01_bin.83]